MATTIAARTPGVASNTAGASLTVPLASGAAAGDTAVLVYAGGGGQPDSTPSGWLLLWAGDDASLYTSVYTKTLTSGDVTTGSVTFAVTAAGKKSGICGGYYSTAGRVSPLRVAAVKETATTATHATSSVTVPGPATVLSILTLKDTTTSVSAQYATPSGIGTAVVSASGGSSQTVAALAVNSGGDAAAGSFAAGSWTVKDASNVNATSNHAATVTITLCPVRPLVNVTAPAGVTYTGGADMATVAGDDSPATYFEHDSGTWELRCNVSSVVPTFCDVTFGVNGPVSSSSIHWYLYQGATLLLDLGTDTTIITDGFTKTLDLSGLSGAQQTAILSAGYMSVRAVCSVS